MTKILLNVYDLNPQVNGYTYSCGLGLFHSGVEINGIEYSFGGHGGNFTGVMELEPRENHSNFRESILLGVTSYKYNKIILIIDELREKFFGNTYHIVKKNCNHFSQRLVRELLGVEIPGYINRLANIGSIFISCLDFLRLEKVESKKITYESLRQRKNRNYSGSTTSSTFSASSFSKSSEFKGKSIQIGECLIEDEE